LATIVKLPSDKWRVQIRRKGHVLSSTFAMKRDADSWARRIESEIDVGKTPTIKNIGNVKTFGALIDLHIVDMAEVGKLMGRSKIYSLDLLKAKLGSTHLENLNREKIIQFGKLRAKDGAGPVTVGIDIGYIKTILTHGAAIHGLNTSVEQVNLARVALKRLGLVGKGQERSRRPTEEEIERLIADFDRNPRLTIPMSEIIQFAIATAMREDEICRARWEDVNFRLKTLIIRDRKDPKVKAGNNQYIPLLSVSGYDAWAILEKRRIDCKKVSGRIFPYNTRSVGTAFHRACNKLGIDDLRFHDLRHEGTSRLFEAGFTIEQTALVTGHKDWKMLRRYTHLKPEHLHTIGQKLRRENGGAL
jgi:integrase